ncbi:N-methyl-L-tryptophan oxidase [bacterium]|nr:N-methyl-L-tryptophan oxidase [bacterium]
MSASTETFDVIVVGTGGFGSSCLHHLAKRGLHVLGVDRFSVAHDRGSSHGDTRIIRQAYFEHPDYVPLLLRAYELWRELECESGRDLMRLCGLLVAGPSDGEAVPGAKLAAKLHGIELQQLEVRDTADRFPAFRVPAGFEVVFEPAAGFLFVEDCVRTHASLATQHGAILQTGDAVLDWSSDGSRVRVVTESATYEAASLVLTPGAWAGHIPHLADCLPPIEVRRKPLLWHPVSEPHFHVDAGMPGFFFEMPDGEFYGFPSLDGATLKVAQHTGGDVVTDPLSVDRSLHPSDIGPVAGFLQNVMPGVMAEPTRHAVCLYSMSPDSHFIIDRHPEFTNVVFGAGFSGHGFKFTSVIGEALADLAETGATKLPIDFLSLERFAD